MVQAAINSLTLCLLVAQSASSILPNNACLKGSGSFIADK